MVIQMAQINELEFVLTELNRLFNTCDFKAEKMTDFAPRTWSIAEDVLLYDLQCLSQTSSKEKFDLHYNSLLNNLQDLMDFRKEEKGVHTTFIKFAKIRIASCIENGNKIKIDELHKLFNFCRKIHYSSIISFDEFVVELRNLGFVIEVNHLGHDKKPNKNSFIYINGGVEQHIVDRFLKENNYIVSSKDDSIDMNSMYNEFKVWSAKKNQPTFFYHEFRERLIQLDFKIITHSVSIDNNRTCRATIFGIKKSERL
jgi:hypothetical protein